MFTGIADAYAYFLAGGAGMRAAIPPSICAVPEADGDMGLAHPAIRQVLDQLLPQGASAPALGFEHMDEGVIVATAEAAWPDRKIAMTDAAMQEDSEALSRAGWTGLTFKSSGLTPEETEAIFTAMRGKV